MVDFLYPKSAFGPLTSIDKLKPVSRQQNSMYKKKNNKSRQKKERDKELDQSHDNNLDVVEISLDEGSDFKDAKDNKRFVKKELNKKHIDIKI